MPQRLEQPVEEHAAAAVVRAAAAATDGFDDYVRRLHPRAGSKPGLEAQVDAAQQLTQYGERAVEPLCDALTTIGWRVRAAAARSLGEIGDPSAVEPLLAVLAQADANTRLPAIEALGRLRDPRAVEPLCRHLTGQVVTVCKAAAEGLGQIGSADAVAPLAALLQDRDAAVRTAAAGALGQIGSTDAVEPLCRLLDDKQGALRVAAAEALGKIGDDRAVQPLMKAMRSCFSGGSARRHLTLGIVVVTLTVIVIAGLFWGLAVAKMAGAFGGLINLAIQAVKGIVKKRSANTEVCRAITEALESIAEREPTPELAAIVPDLRAVAADAIQQAQATRTAAREAADRIETLTQKIKSLPISSVAPGVSEETLPRPADAPAPDTRQLPRV